MGAKGVDQNIVNSIRAFDFSATEELGFIHTIGGAHMGDAWQRTGWPGLGRAVERLGLHTSGEVNVDFVTSSVGSLTMAFIRRLYAACKGRDGLARTINNHSTAQKAYAALNLEPDGTQDVGDRFNIYFPTHETVRASRAGSAGTICIQSSYYNNDKFPRDLMHDCKSVRRGLLMHNKMLYVRPLQGKAWAYIGSANCSESAWGNKIVKDKLKKEPKLNCRNWECGVIVPVDSAVGTDETKNELGMEVFKGKVTVSMEYPGDKYAGRKPWYFMEQP